MTDIKITVVKQFSPKDVLGHEFIKEDGNPITKCSMKEGLEFIIDDSGIVPEEFCQNAFNAIYNHISILRTGGAYTNWTGKDVIYSACPDGIRPVCFKLERISK